MDADIESIVFYPGEEGRAFLVGTGLPFRFVKIADARFLPGKVFVLTLKADQEAEMAAAQEDARRWWRRVLDFVFGANTISPRTA